MEFFKEFAKKVYYFYFSRSYFYFGYFFCAEIKKLIFNDVQSIVCCAQLDLLVQTRELIKYEFPFFYCIALIL